MYNILQCVSSTSHLNLISSNLEISKTTKPCSLQLGRLFPFLVFHLKLFETAVLLCSKCSSYTLDHNLKQQKHTLRLISYKILLYFQQHAIMKTELKVVSVNLAIRFFAFTHFWHNFRHSIPPGNILAYSSAQVRDLCYNRANPKVLNWLALWTYTYVWKVSNSLTTKV